jgi:hypothetical protein
MATRKRRGGGNGTSLTGPLNSRGFVMTPMGVVAPRITVFNGGAKKRKTRRGRRGTQARRRR